MNWLLGKYAQTTNWWLGKYDQAINWLLEKGDTQKGQIPLTTGPSKKFLPAFGRTGHLGGVRVLIRRDEVHVYV